MIGTASFNECFGRVLSVTVLGLTLTLARGESPGSLTLTNISEAVSGDAVSSESLYLPLFDAESDKWQLGILLYGFLPLESELTSKLPGLPPLPETSVSLDLSDALELLNMTFSGRLEAHRGDLGLFLEGYYVTFALDNSLVKVDFDQYFVDFGCSVKLPPLRLSENGRAALYSELAVGARYVHFRQDITLKGIPASRGASANYLEPFVGGRLTLPFAEKWSFVTRGDVGGFGIGSDLTWTVVGGFAFRPAPRWDVGLGYRVYSLDYKDGSGVNEFRLEAFQHGPYLGVGFRF